MSSLMMHEIYIPLSSISGSVAILKKHLENTIPPEQRLASDAYESCRRIEETSTMLLKIVRSLTQMEKDETPEAFVLTSIGDIVRNALELTRVMFIKSGVQLYFEQSQTLEFPIECRPHEIVQVLLNLLKNGVEAVDGLEEKWVRLEIKKVGIYIYFRVIDSGRGVEKSIRSDIFEPFFTTKTQKVNGIGLYLSRRIVEAHNGELTLEEDTKNTSFVMRLPILQSRKR
ncbi:MAG: HAMP domain-containing histidine kinase [Deltaproteobacteria bacterium]|nr:MAG: HAMP domain-containing histidine kinase [Deltaproteobacteria bacterium]